MLLSSTACANDTDKAGLIQAIKLELWKRGAECKGCAPNDLASYEAAFKRVWGWPTLALRGGYCGDGAGACTPPASPDLSALKAKLGPDFAAAIARNEAEHKKDCEKSCETFYCGSGPSSFTLPEMTLHSMGDVPPEDFASDFNFPLDLIKVSA